MVTQREKARRIKIAKQHYPIANQYPTLLYLLGLFKDLKPRVSKQQIEETLWYRKGKLTDSEKLLRKNKKEVWISTEDLYGNERIRTSPDGAAILAKLYEDGYFDSCKKKKSTLCVPDELTSFINSKQALEDAYESQIEARVESEILREEMIENPDLVDEKQFSYTLLNDIFIHKFGLFQGANSLRIGGINVTKRVHTYTSNSGKSRDSEVIFSWIGKDGEPHSIEKYSMYAGNRRNSEDRNWGLPE